MHWISTVLLGIATNLDNLFIGLTVGLQGKRITGLSNLCIALGSAVTALICCYLASLCTSLGRLPNYLGGGLLILLGIWPLLPKKKRGQPATSTAVQKCMPEKSVASRQQFEPIAWRQTVVLSLALALNCIATAFGAGLTGLTAIPVAITVGVCSFLSVGVGNYMGRYTKANLQKNWMEIAASIAMMGLGILEMVV